MASGKKATNANVSLASPFMIVASPPVAALEISDILKNRRYTQLVVKPNKLNHRAVSVPRRGPESIFAMTKAAGKCLILILINPLKRETVCSGYEECMLDTSFDDFSRNEDRYGEADDEHTTNCFRQTRKPASKATRPLIGVGLNSQVRITSPCLITTHAGLTTPEEA